MLQRIWKFFGNVNVTFYILLLISVNLIIGSFYSRIYPQIFRPLNNFLLQDWFRFYGENYPEKIWWLSILFALLFMLGVNIFVCTLNSIFHLWLKRKQMSLKVFSLRITPSLIHICFLIMLTGHLMSMISGFNFSMNVEPGEKTSLPIQTSIRVLDKNCDFYNSPELLRGIVKQCAVSLELGDSWEKTVKQIRFLEPLFWKGFSLHLMMDKKADASKIKLIIKKDPGRKLILFGFVFLVSLMLWYFTQINKGNKKE